ncbi:flagellar basal body rod protein [Priestia aryabhattai]|uniref:lmo0954 family membrane protein n=1 Tax=Priestia aryabhattai TaxID=412384 RepID=UPI001C0A9C7A|nr:flagellar basal body rod protein [Priestia aryabhattai]MBU3570389.1 flagellar basal body rod protein [Priestia aryabhattai]WDL88171.1 flagellar basal body rod protein [Priestia aryabhattai]
MKKVGLFLIGAVAAIVLLANAGPMVGLALGLAILYVAFKGFVKAEISFKKWLWGFIGVVVLLTTVSNLPALAGIIAAVVLYTVYKKWNSSSPIKTEKEDPFKHFERQWADLNQK